MKNLINDNDQKQDLIDILIIGGGPAGMSAGIYAARAGLKTIILEKEAPGGKMVKTDLVENYPGYDSILGPDLSMKMFNQVTNLGAEFVFNEAAHVLKKEDKTFETHLIDGTILKSKTVVVATGTKENELEIPGEKEFYGKGVSYCAVCDGAFHKGKPVAIVGGGYSAVTEGQYLTKFVDKLYVIVRKDHFRADEWNVNNLKNTPGVEFLMNTIVTKVNGTNKVESITVQDLKTKQERDIQVTGLFPYIGAKPISQFVSNLDITNNQGYIIADPKMETKIDGLFVAGDVREVPLRQISIAAGDGAMAGQKAIEYLQNLR